MRILVVGAGAIGGFFGGRLLAAGRDVTFLVRERRAAQLAKTGLVIKSKLGDVSLPSPPLVSAETAEGARTTSYCWPARRSISTARWPLSLRRSGRALRSCRC